MTRATRRTKACSAANVIILGTGNRANIKALHEESLAELNKIHQGKSVH
jgi:hypothetical protein